VQSDEEAKQAQKVAWASPQVLQGRDAGPQWRVYKPLEEPGMRMV